MKEYEIKVELGAIYYTLEGKNEDDAIETAKDLIYYETMHDLLKGARYTINESDNN